MIRSITYKTWWWNIFCIHSFIYLFIYCFLSKSKSKWLQLYRTSLIFPILFCSRPPIWISGSLALPFPTLPRSGLSPYLSLSFFPSLSLSLLLALFPSGHTHVTVVFNERLFLRSSGLFVLFTCQFPCASRVLSLVPTGFAHFCLCCLPVCMRARAEV